MIQANLHPQMTTSEATIQTEAEGLVFQIGPHAEPWTGQAPASL